MKTLRELFERLPPDGDVRHALRNFNLSPRINGKAKSVKELAESIGFSVFRAPLPSGMAGRLVQDPFSDNGYAIEVNSSGSVESQRWAVLHEMGHYFLHSNHTDPLADPMHLDRSGYAFYENPTEEREANEFAAVLLFGNGALNAAKALYGNKVSLMARHFGVSEKTIRIALRQF